jgi:hypothetical protein
MWNAATSSSAVPVEGGDGCGQTVCAVGTVVIVEVEEAVSGRSDERGDVTPPATFWLAVIDWGSTVAHPARRDQVSVNDAQ